MAFVPSIVGCVAALSLVANATASPTSGALERITVVHAAGWLLASSAGYAFDDLTLDIDISLPGLLRRVVTVRALIVSLLWLPATIVALAIANAGLHGRDALPLGLLFIEYLAMLVVALAVSAQVFATRDQPRTHMGLVSVIITGSVLGVVFLLPWQTKPWVELRTNGNWEAQPGALVVIGLAAVVTIVQVARPMLRWPVLIRRVSQAIAR